MTAKELKKYSLIIALGAMEAQDENILVYFTELAGNDFQTAFEMWEWKLGANANALADPAIAYNLETRVFGAFQNTSDSRLRQLLPSSPQLLKLIYNNSATAASAGNLAYLSSLVLTNKVEPADEIFKLIATNKTGDYAERMKIILDDIFQTYCAKNNTKVASLNRKQQMLLLEYALKIKGPNKNLLVQRIKELS